MKRDHRTGELVSFGLTQYQGIVRRVSLDEAEKIRDRSDAIVNAPNVSPLRHQALLTVTRGSVYSPRKVNGQ
jgi:hypothetical protein